MHNSAIFYDRERILKVMNLLARDLKVLTQYEKKKPFSHLYSLKDFDRVSNIERKFLNSSWDKNISNLVDVLESEISELETGTENKRYIRAHEIALWIDTHLTYDTQCSNPDFISVFCLCEANFTKYNIVYSLNNNVDETGIWINPKFPIRSSYDAYNAGRSKGVSSRDAYFQINCELANYAYFQTDIDNPIKIKNIIIKDKNILFTDSFNVAFAPLSSRDKLLKSNTIDDPSDDNTKFQVVFDDQDNEIYNRMIRDWRLACSEGANIVFMPETLGTDKVRGNDIDSPEWMSDLVLSEFEDGSQPPLFTIWPSYCSDQENTAFVMGRDGTIWGSQKKYYPFIDKVRHKEEALRDYNQREYLIIHIPNVHRIAILICAEFLSDNETKWSDILCRSLGVSFLIVPSYSTGEQDFLNQIGNYVNVDTTVIWGNCCGAIKSNHKSIGAFSKPGENSNEIFNRNACSGSCDGVNACIFLAKFPVKRLVFKEIKNNRNTVKHIVDRKECE